MAYSKPFSSSQLVDEANLERWRITYGVHFTAAYKANPANYRKPPDEVIAAIISNIRNRGIGSIAIETPTWKAAAKDLGIKNTYGAWREFFAAKS